MSGKRKCNLNCDTPIQWVKHPVIYLKKMENSLSSVNLPPVLADLLSVGGFSRPWLAAWLNEMSMFSAVVGLHCFPADSGQVWIENMRVRCMILIQITSYCSPSVKKPAAISHDVILSRLVERGTMVSCGNNLPRKVPRIIRNCLRAEKSNDTYLDCQW